MKKSEVKSINGDHRRAVKAREKALKKLKTNLGYYTGDQWSDAALSAYNEPVVDNMVFKAITTILPSIFVRNPHVYVTPSKKPYQENGRIFDTIEAASVVELLLNHHISGLQLKREMRRAGLDASLGGPGYIQCGYDLDTEIVESGETEEEDGSSNIPPNELVKNDSPWFMRRPMKDVLVDANCTDHLLNDAEWVAFRVVKRLSDVKADKLLKNTRELESNYSPSDDDNAESAFKSPAANLDGKGSSEKWLEYWIRWDKRRKSVITYVEDDDNVLAEESWPIKYDGFPLEVLYWNEKPDNLFPMSDVELMIHQQDYLNRLESLQLDHVRRISSAKYVATEGSIDENEMLKLTNGPSGTIGYVKTSPPNAAIMPLADNAISQDQYMLAGQIKNNIRETLGIAAYESGVSQKFDTAAEPELIAQGVNLKRDDRKDMVADMWKRVTKKLLLILQETMEKAELPLAEGQFNTARRESPSKLSRIVGANGEVVLLPFLNVSKEDIQGEYEFNIDIGSEKPDNEATRRADIANTFGAIPPQMWAHMNVPKSLKHILTVGLGPVVASELQRDPAEVAREQQGAAQAQFQQAIQLEQMKHQIPGQTKIQIADINSKTTLAAEKMRTDAQGDVQKSVATANQANTVFKAIVDSQDKPEKSD